MTKEEEKEKVSEANRELLNIIEELSSNDGKHVVVLNSDELASLKKMLEDRKAIGRVWGILKTILYATAATIVAYNTVFEGGLRAISHLFGIDGTKQ